MAAVLRAIAFLLSAGCVFASSLFLNAQDQPSEHCSRAQQAKAWRAMEQGHPQIPTKLTSVTFEGDIHMPVPEQEQMAEALKQRAWTSDPALFELSNEAEEVVRQQWQEHGYFKVEVTKAEASLLSGGSAEQVATLTVYIDEGPLYRLGDITFKNVTAFPLDQVRALFSMQPGDLFYVSKVRAALDALRQLYGAQGYINFTSVPDTQLDETDRRISLVIDADEGKQFRVSRTEIVGLDAGLAAMLLQRWTIKPGEVYNSSLIARFFAENASLLPPGAGPDDNIDLGFDHQQATVAVTLDFRACQ